MSSAVEAALCSVPGVDLATCLREALGALHGGWDIERIVSEVVPMCQAHGDPDHPVTVEVTLLHQGHLVVRAEDVTHGRALQVWEYVPVLP